MTILTRADLESLDAGDPLAGHRSDFHMAEGVIYLDGNSLGALPRATPDRLDRLIRGEWGDSLIRSWNDHDWIGLPQRVGDKIAPLVGAEAGEVVAADTTSINIFKLASAAVKLAPERRVILAPKGDFPTDAYVLEGLIAQLGPGHELRLVEADALISSLDENVALVVLSHVHYRTGRMWDMAGLTAAAQGVGALILWDLCHSAGACPVDLNGCGADLAVGCGYKFLCGGPGAPAFLFVAKALQESIEPVLSGWMGHAEPFAFDGHYRPAPDISRNLCGTPAVLGLAALECGVEAVARAPMEDVRKKSMKMGEVFLELVAERCGGQCEPACPADAKSRGSQVSLRHAQGYAIMQALIARGVIGDFRPPDVLRFGFSPLYNRYVDLWNAVDALADILENGAWERPEFQERAKVT